MTSRFAFVLCSAVAAAMAASSPARADADWPMPCRKPAAAAPAEKTATPEMPAGNIFGFTDPSDVGSVGDCGFALEVTGRAGKHGGRYFAGGAKHELAATVTDNLALAVSAFTAWYHIRNVAGLDDRRSFAFDGLSAELQYRFLERAEGNPLALTAAVEPRWARTGPVGGERTQAYGVELKLFADIVLSEHWFAAVNLNYLPAWEKGRDATRFSHFSGTNFSAAIAWAPGGADSTVVLGLESRLLAAFEGLALQRHITHAWFVGPNMLVNIADGVALSLAWTPQIAGSGRGVAGRRDLDNFERHQFRIKLALGL